MQDPLAAIHKPHDPFCALIYLEPGLLPANKKSVLVETEVETLPPLSIISLIFSEEI